MQIEKKILWMFVFMVCIAGSLAIQYTYGNNYALNTPNTPDATAMGVNITIYVSGYKLTGVNVSANSTRTFIAIYNCTSTTKVLLANSSIGANMWAYFDILTAAGQNYCALSGGTTKFMSSVYSMSNATDIAFVGRCYFPDCTTSGNVYEIQGIKMNDSVPGPSPTTLNITLYNSYDNSSIPVFNVTANNGTNTFSQLTTNGSIYGTNLTGNWKFNFTIPSYIQSNIIANYTLTGDQTIKNYSLQSLFNVTAREKITNNSLTSFNASLPSSSNETAGSSLFLVTNNVTQNVTISKAGYFPAINSAQATSGQITNVQATLYTHNLTINASDILTGNIVSNFSVTIHSLNYSYVESINTTTGKLSFYGIAGTYNISLDAEGYVIANQTITLTSSIYYPNVTFILQKFNSVAISIYDEVTGSLIIQNVSVQFSSNSSLFTNYTTTGSLYLWNISANIYSVTFSVNLSSYSQRTYTLTISNRSTQNLNAYLAQNTSIVTFPITDRDTSALLDGVLSSMYRFINGSWQAVESKSSDITGRVQFTYLPLTQYKFFFSKTGYTDLVFYLNPVIYSSYDIQMEKSVTANVTDDYEGVSIIYAPTIFYANSAVNFTFIIQSPSGSLIGYGFNISYPGGSQTALGVNAIGSTLSVNFSIGSATISDRVMLDYYYWTSTQGIKNFTYYYPILSSNNQTMAGQYDPTYGMGMWERILIVTIIIIIFAGIPTMVGKPYIGGALGLFIAIFFVSVEFVPWWAFALSLFAGVILLGTKGEGQ